MHELAHLVTDIVVFSRREGNLCVLLIKRAHPPAQGKWCLPGGHLDKGERFDEAALRELAEETGLSNVRLERLDVFDGPDRDPRYRTVSVAYACLTEGEARAASDAEDIRWIPVKSMPSMPFDHDDIVRTAIEWADTKGL